MHAVAQHSHIQDKNAAGIAPHLLASSHIQQHARHKQLPGVFIQVLLYEAIGAGWGMPQGFSGVCPRLAKSSGLAGLLSCLLLGSGLFGRSPLLHGDLVARSCKRFWSLGAWQISKCHLKVVALSKDLFMLGLLHAPTHCDEADTSEPQRDTAQKGHYD